MTRYYTPAWGNRSLHTPGLAKTRPDTAPCPHCDGQGRDAFERGRSQTSPYLVDFETHCDVCRNEGRVGNKIAKLYHVGGVECVRDWDDYLFGVQADWSSAFQPEQEPTEPHSTNYRVNPIWFHNVYEPWALRTDVLGRQAYAALIKRYSRTPR